jgi:uncharacterized protein (TIGR04255 family)
MKDTPGKKSSRARDGRFHPLNKAHAIVEVVFFIQFSREFSKPSLARFSSLRYDLENDLPKFSEVQKLSFAFGPDGSIAQQDLGGIELQRIKRDGNLEWMLRIHENVISVALFGLHEMDNSMARGF